MLSSGASQGIPELSRHTRCRHLTNKPLAGEGTLVTVTIRRTQVIGTVSTLPGKDPVAVGEEQSHRRPVRAC